MIKIKNKKVNKKGIEMIFSTWVIIVLSVILLIFLVLFFTMGSSSFINTIKGYFSKTNVDSVIKSCNILVDSNARYEFCCEDKMLKYKDAGIKEVSVTCSEFSKMEISNNEVKSNIDCSLLNC
jgi:hypothetical protein